MTHSAGASSSAAAVAPPAQRPLELPPVMENVLRPHQVSALEFLWRRLVLDGTLRIAARTFSSTIEQRTRLYQEVFGVILAHSMGLGKTLTSLSFVLLLQAQATLMALKRDRVRQQQLQQQARIPSGGAATSTLKGAVCPTLRVLVVCPRSCVLHWQASVAEWVQPRFAGTLRLDAHVPSAVGASTSAGPRGARLLEEVLLRYYQNGGLLVLGYEEYQRVLLYAQAQHRSGTGGTWPRVWSLLDRLRLPLPHFMEVCLLDILETADLVVLDEAHRLRRSTSNLVTALTEHLRHIQLRLALTGTPLQNHLEEYNTMQALVTGRELDTQLFNKHFIAPIERGQCVDSTYPQFLEMQRCVASLRKYFADSAHRCGPEVLAATLPPRREFLFFFALSAAQATAYRAMLKHFQAQLGSGERAESVLQLHHTASHICLHPALAEVEAGTAASPAGSPAAPGGTAQAAGLRDDEDGDEDGATSTLASPTLPSAALGDVDVSLSPKLHFAVLLTRHIVLDLREKVVIFSQYLSHLRLMGELLARDGIAAPALTGLATDAERRRCIAELQTSEACRVLLCSVRAGGVGIKLTAANHCILLDVSWNPADDVQATYRLYRYGQLRPVTIYRLATYGTSEHVVFAYALHKSWLQKKITDISDPRRQQRHQTRSYFRYPCAVPLPEDGSGLPDAEDQDMSPAQREAVAQRRTAYAVDVCEAQCPAAAHVLHADAGVQACLHTVIPQSVLLRHSEEDVIQERGRRFEEAVLRSRATAPVPLPTHPGGAVHAHARDKVGLLDACEPTLVDAARQAAHVLLIHALHAREERATAAGRRGSDTVSEVRTLDQQLCVQLKPLLVTELGQRPAPRFLAEALLVCYQAGAADVCRAQLLSGAYLKLRTALASRVPAAGRRRPRDAGLPERSPLEETLLYSPASLFKSMSAVEATYMVTELGCDRPFVGSCVLRGLQRLWLVQGRPVLGDAALQALAELLGTPAEQHDAASDEDSADEGARTNAAELAAERRTALAQSVLGTLLGCLEEQWPPYEGFALPTLHMQLEREEGRVGRVYSAAAQAHLQGFLPLSHVAEVLRLPPFRREQHLYGCSRCRNPMLQRVDATHLSCSRCHYNAEFEVRADPRTQQQVMLYQLSVVANLLDAFSITQSFAVSFSPVDCADVSAALREVHTSQAVFGFVQRLMKEGVRVFVSEYPPQLVRLLGLQLGVGGDVDELRRVLLANGRLAVHGNVREHLRQRLADAYAAFVAPSALTRLSAMPLMFLATALHFLARCEKLTYAHELLTEECPTPRRKLLRFASDALVKVLYVERLLRHCREKPAPSTYAASASGAGRVTGAGDASGGEERGDDVTSLHSLLMAASSSSDASRSSASPSPSTSSRTLLSDSDEEERAGCRGVTARRVGAEVHVISDDSGGDSSGSGSSGSSRSSSLSSSTSRSLSGSFHSAYSRDRESFPEGTDSDAEAQAKDGPFGAAQDAGTWLEELARQTAEPAVPTAEELEGEAVQQQRSAQYWIAFCEVYGTHSAEALTVYIEDTANGVKVLPPPPMSLWLSQVAHTSTVGHSITDMLDLFFKKLLELSQQVRVIA